MQTADETRTADQKPDGTTAPPTEPRPDEKSASPTETRPDETAQTQTSGTRPSILIGDDYYRGKVRYVNMSLDDKPLDGAKSPDTQNSSASNNHPTNNIKNVAAAATASIKAAEEKQCCDVRFDNELLSLEPVVTTTAATADETALNEEADEEVSFKPADEKSTESHPEKELREDISATEEERKRRREDILASEEVRLMAQIISDLNSDPVVVLGKDKLTEEVIQKHQAKRRRK